MRCICDFTSSYEDPATNIELMKIVGGSLLDDILAGKVPSPPNPRELEERARQTAIDIGNDIKAGGYAYLSDVQRNITGLL